MNWYIGQDIVAVRDHEEAKFKRGDEFKIKGLMTGVCNCHPVLIDIGAKSINKTIMFCRVCGFKMPVIEVGQTIWFGEYNFAPLDPIKEAISNLIEETLTVKQL